ncbi:AAA family ATPase [Rathayibacter festucae]|uniref:AAA family ATPase n=1 Tax=Rathayibacter festucae TaxID=110937 RepID=UPI001FB1D1D6|nr:AAA family ATPase [Rathayibacter festucae]MCJ1702137.1 AAA family ATPase [Rathayibacter festucae]
MASQPIEAVFAFFYGTAAHNATYGRFPGSTTFSKDYLQLIQDSVFLEALARMFPPSEAGATKTVITYRWPGGKNQGFVVFKSGDRPHFAWSITEGAPLPWKMTPSPTEEGPETVPGDPNLADAALATQQFEELALAGIHPYLIAVKLRGEANVLHVRAYLKDPPPELEFANIDQLPEDIRALALKAVPTRAFKWGVFDSRSALMDPDVADAIERLKENPSLLLTGPPGTGKTVLLEKLTGFIKSPRQEFSFDPERNHDAWGETLHEAPAGITRTIVLHPSYAYDNLVIGLLPTPAANGGVGVKVATGPLVNLAHYSASTGAPALLVLDEFNRGNAAAILGDTLALLDKDKRGRAFIDLPYADLTIEVPKDFRGDGDGIVSPRFTLPPNLWIVAAMNSSDRSVAPLDAALRRRFTIVEMGPNYDALAAQLAADVTADFSDPLSDWTIGHVGKLAVELLKALNARIDGVLGTDFRLGQSNLWNTRANTVEEGIRNLAAAFDHRIVQTLRLSLQDDDGSLAAILRAGTADKPEGGPEAPARWTPADSTLGTFATDRVHIRPLSGNTNETIVEELRRQALLG